MRSWLCDQLCGRISAQAVSKEPSYRPSWNLQDVGIELAIEEHFASQVDFVARPSTRLVFEEIWFDSEPVTQATTPLSPAPRSLEHEPALLKAIRRFVFRSSDPMKRYMQLTGPDLIAYWDRDVKKTIFLSTEYGRKIDPTRASAGLTTLPTMRRGAGCNLADVNQDSRSEDIWILGNPDNPSVPLAGWKAGLTDMSDFRKLRPSGLLA
ncbi:hypothetical protein DXG01_014794 [Tephrocybe rancida]|nr:hypothetical protein DXG01_014794 [Tephrocybe rancida]